MEPWPFSHGYTETMYAVLGAAQPSMEPWPFSHGYRLGDRRDQPAVAPSMEPWPFSHGYVGLVDGCRPLDVSFNGAMAFQPWIHGSLNDRVGIRFCLQWSHGLSAMDTIVLKNSIPASLIPSMEPWPFSHGYPDLSGREPPARAPSMEPWPFSHGYAHPPRLCVRRPIPSMEPWPFSHGYVFW